MTDDQGYGDYGFQGHPVLRTPELDALAQAATRVEPFYVSPVCTPTRASLMTGRYSYRTRAIDTWIGRAMMEPEELTIAELLREAGYATGIFGKWHLGDCAPMRPQEQGFERVLVHRGGGIGQPADPPGGEGKYTNPLLVDDGVLREFPGYCTDVYFEQALRWMRTAHAAGRPFFCYLPTNAPHGPLHDVPEELYLRYVAQGVPDREARIYAMIENIDTNLGRLRTGLREMGVEQDTLVVFLSDNGPAGQRYNAGLRGAKSDVYEGGVRTVFLAEWPGRLPAGGLVEHISAHIDLMPTLLEACGLLLPVDRTIDGRSFWPELSGERPTVPIETDTRALVLQSHRGDVPIPEHHFLLREGRWKLVRPSGFGRQRPAADAPGFELYDLQKDPSETTDLAAANPELVARLRARYGSWWDSVSQERADNFAPPRIVLGGTAELVTTLTRQDIRMPEGRDWGMKVAGQWLVDIRPADGYALDVRVPAWESESRLRAELGGRVAEVVLPAGSTGAALELRAVSAGLSACHVARIDANGKAHGVHQVDVRALRD